MVGYIAAQQLSDEAERLIAGLLDGESLADASTWADEIKSDREWDWARPLHYANVTDGATSFAMGRDCPPEGCVVRAILEYSEVLATPTASRERRAEALRFLVHFVGDVHQPLHVSRAEDRGGNTIRVEFFGRKTNLHRVWDTELIDWAGKDWRSYADELLGTISPAQVSEWLSETEPAAWASESYRLALSRAYAIPADGRLAEEYFRTSQPVIENRLMAAGVRLGHLLNRIARERVEARGESQVAGEARPYGLPPMLGAALLGAVLLFACWQASRPRAGV